MARGRKARKGCCWISGFLVPCGAGVNEAGFYCDYHQALYDEVAEILDAQKPSMFRCDRCGWRGVGTEGCGTHGCNPIQTRLITP